MNNGTKGKLVFRDLIQHISVLNKGLLTGVKSDSIAVDWIGQNLYWVDGLVGQILVVKLSDITVRSQSYTVALGEDLEQPSSLILLPHMG